VYDGFAVEHHPVVDLVERYGGGKDLHEGLRIHGAEVQIHVVACGLEISNVQDCTYLADATYRGSSAYEASKWES